MPRPRAVPAHSRQLFARDRASVTLAGIGATTSLTRHFGPPTDAFEEGRRAGPDHGTSLAIHKTGHEYLISGPRQEKPHARRIPRGGSRSTPALDTGSG